LPVVNKSGKRASLRDGKPTGPRLARDRNWKFSQLILAPDPSKAHMVVAVHWLLARLSTVDGKCSYRIQKTGDGLWT